MEEQVYQELKTLCQKIIDSDQKQEPARYLEEVRNLEEKLILLDYLRFRRRSLSAKTGGQTATGLDQELSNTLKQAEQQRQESLFAAPAQSEMREEAPPEPESIVPSKEVVPEPAEESAEKPRKQSINDSLASGQIKLGLNDRLAFTKHLFSGSQEDLNRVISQLNTFTSYPEAEQFIEQMVKPEYNWEQQEEYEERLMELVRARFGKD
jgi:hypothetical protein